MTVRTLISHKEAENNFPCRFSVVARFRGMRSQADEDEPEARTRDRALPHGHR